MENIRISLPLDPQQVKTLRAGDTVLLTGTLYTGRDAAHKRLVACIERGEPLPIPLENQLIYYVGPCAGVARPCRRLCGP